jgi:5-methylcytosine-specific restriction endonuclease McrA
MKQSIESLAHDIIRENNIGCAVCGRKDDIHLHHIIEDSKANRKIAGDMLHLLGVNTLPVCTQCHADLHAGIYINGLKRWYELKKVDLYDMAKKHLQARIDRFGGGL